MSFLRRRRRAQAASGAGAAGAGGAGSDRRPVLLAVDLHPDFCEGGPLGRPGATAAADRLAPLVEPLLRDLQPAGNYSEGALVVEGIFWADPPSVAEPCSLPTHCRERPTFAAGLKPSSWQHFTWEACPACGGDPLAGRASGKDQGFSIEHWLSFHPGREVHIAGLGAEHGAVPLARAVAASRRLRDAGVVPVLLLDHCTWLGAPPPAAELSGYGIQTSGQPPG